MSDSRISVLNLKNVVGLSESSYNHYQSRIKRLLDIVGKDRDLMWIMTHPVETIKFIKANISVNASTIANHCVVVCKLFSVHPSLMSVQKEPYLKWSKLLQHYRLQETSATKQSEFNKRQEQNIVSWKEVQDMYCELRENGALSSTNLKTLMEALLLAIFTGIQAKRADFGAVRIYETRDEAMKEKANQRHENYIFFSPYPMLVLNKFKTVKSIGAIRETLGKELVKDIQSSLSAFPRDYLFISPKTHKPYWKNNSYSAFVKRTFYNLFSRAMGVSLWRHIYIGANVDFNAMSYKDLEEGAKLRGHSIEQELMTYRKFATNEKLENIKRPKDEQGKPVQCKPQQPR